MKKFCKYRLYSNFEIMARAKEDVFLSAYCECVSMFESFFAYHTLKDRRRGNIAHAIGA